MAFLHHYLLCSVAWKPTTWTGLQRGEQHTWRRQATASSPHLDEDGGFPRLWVAIETLRTQNSTGGCAALFHLGPFSASAILHRRQRETWGSALTMGDRPRAPDLFYCAASPSKKMCQAGQSDFTVTLLATTLQYTIGSPCCGHSFNLLLYIHLSVELIQFQPQLRCKILSITSTYPGSCKTQSLSCSLKYNICSGLFLPLLITLTNPCWWHHRLFLWGDVCRH